MVVKENPSKTTLAVRLIVGENEKGESIFKVKKLTHIKTEAKIEDLYLIGNEMGDIAQGIDSIDKIDDNLLEGEE